MDIILKRMQKPQKILRRELNNDFWRLNSGDVQGSIIWEYIRDKIDS